MIINKYNIEKWLFDYFEDNLTPHERIELEHFLSNNPHFEEEFEFWKDSFEINNDFPSFNMQNSLHKKSILYNKYTYLFLGVALIFTSVLIYQGTVNNISNKYEANKILEYNSQLYLDSLENHKTESYYYARKNQEINKKSLNNKLYNNKLTTNYYPNNNVSNIVENTKSKNKHKKQNSTPQNNIKEEQATLKSNNKKTLNTTPKRFESKKIKQIDNIYNVKNISTFNIKNNKKLDTYSYLDFKRNNNRVKNKKGEKTNDLSRSREYFENIALIYASYYKANLDKYNFQKILNSIEKLKSKELALTNTHDYIFAINNTNPLENNIALTGGLELTRIKSNITNNWTGSNNEHNNITIATDTYLNKINAGIGIIAKNKNYKHQNYKRTSLGVTYSQRIQLKEEKSISLGVKYTFNMNKYTNINNLKISQNHIKPTINTPDQNLLEAGHSLSSAMWYDGKYFYGGINIENIKYIKNKNNNANEFVEYINPVKFAMQLGTDYRRSVYSAWVISPQLNYRYQKGISELWLGAVLKYKRLLTGFGGSFSDAYKLFLGGQSDSFRIIYGFDLSKSKIENKVYGTHEISLRYILKNKIVGKNKYF